MRSALKSFVVLEVTVEEGELYHQHKEILLKYPRWTECPKCKQTVRVSCRTGLLYRHQRYLEVSEYSLFEESGMAVCESSRTMYREDS